MFVCPRLLKQLQDQVVTEDQNVDVSWQVGCECAVHVSKDNYWYRAVISEITQDSYKVLSVFLTRAAKQPLFLVILSPSIYICLNSCYS